MIKFKTNLYAQFLDSGLYRITRTFKVQILVKKQWFLLKIPVGRKTDLTSVPKIFWSIFSKDDRNYLESAIAHDEFYKLGGVVSVVNLKTNKSETIKISRYQADVFFREGAKVLGSNWFKRNAIFFAVRVGGGSSWNKKSNKVNLSIKKFETSRKNHSAGIRG